MVDPFGIVPLISSYLWVGVPLLGFLFFAKIIPTIDILFRWLANAYGFLLRASKKFFFPLGRGAKKAAFFSAATIRRPFLIKRALLVVALFSGILAMSSFLRKKDYDFFGREKPQPTVIEQVVNQTEALKGRVEGAFFRGTKLERLNWKFKRGALKICCLYLLGVFFITWFIHGDLGSATSGFFKGAIAGAVVSVGSFAAGASPVGAIANGVATMSAVSVGYAATSNYLWAAWAALGILLWLAWFATQSVDAIEMEEIFAKRDILVKVQEGVMMTSDLMSNPLTAAKVGFGGLVGALGGFYYPDWP